MRFYHCASWQANKVIVVLLQNSTSLWRLCSWWVVQRLFDRSCVCSVCSLQGRSWSAGWLGTWRKNAARRSYTRLHHPASENRRQQVNFSSSRETMKSNIQWENAGLQRHKLDTCVYCDGHWWWQGRHCWLRYHTGIFNYCQVITATHAIKRKPNWTHFAFPKSEAVFCTTGPNNRITFRSLLPFFKRFHLLITDGLVVDCRSRRQAAARRRGQRTVARVGGQDAWEAGRVAALARLGTGRRLQDAVWRRRRTLR